MIKCVHMVSMIVIAVILFVLSCKVGDDNVQTTLYKNSRRYNLDRANYLTALGLESSNSTTLDHISGRDLIRIGEKLFDNYQKCLDDYNSGSRPFLLHIENCGSVMTYKLELQFMLADQLGYEIFIRCKLCILIDW